ncbi:MAG: hypothetical protein R2844_00905 [Caldilineales bacterium]
MAAASLEALRHGAAPDIAALIRGLPRPVIAPERLATAELGAAIHTAHRLADFLRRDELVRYWLERALDTSPGIAQTMLDLVAARSVDLPALFTAAQQSNLASHYPLQLQHGWRYDHIDAGLLQAMIEVLGKRDRGLAQQATALLLEHAPPEADLVQKRWLWEPLHQFYPELMPARDRHGWATLRVPWPEARFAWVTPRYTGLTLDVTARLPACKLGTVGITVNGRRTGEFALTTGWTRTVLRIHPTVLQPGLNQIAFHFPPPDSRTDVWSTVADRLSQGLETDLFPVFGEVAQLRIAQVT